MAPQETVPGIGDDDGRTLAKAVFEKSASASRDFPAPDRPEVAFAGRSNAGKSSAINAVCARRKLARTSKTPGRTQLINFFSLETARLVDLPGYGYARVPPKVRAAWQALVESYLGGRRNLRGVVLIMDARREPTEFDQQLLDWGADLGLAFHLLLTKADKLGRNAQVNALRRVRTALPATSAQLFSAQQPLGVTEARQRLAEWLKPDPPPDQTY